MCETDSFIYCFTSLHILELVIVKFRQINKRCTQKISMLIIWFCQYLYLQIQKVVPEPNFTVVMSQVSITDTTSWVFFKRIFWSMSSWGQSAAASGDAVIGGQITGPWYALEPLHRNNKCLSNQKHMKAAREKKKKRPCDCSIYRDHTDNNVGFSAGTKSWRIEFHEVKTCEKYTFNVISWTSIFKND